jgi:hypothetical protein
MRKPGARHTQSHRAFGFFSLWLLLASSVAISCDVYDASLVRVRPLQRPDAGPPPTDAGHDAGMDAGDQDAGEEPECVFNALDEFCQMRCKETCNDLDDDCDGLVDETRRGAVCNLSAATSVCVAGTCLIAACDAGHVDCNETAEDGCEATLDSVETCGACTRRCELPNAVPECNAGKCGVERCMTGWDDCDGKPENGCERQLDKVTDCGACGASCRIPNATAECGSDGKCKFDECEPGWGNCNESTDDGCETDLGEPSSCGACGAQCPGDKPYCTGGKCTSIVCADGSADCNGDNMVCETDLGTVTNCGACGVDCGTVANASVSCNAERVCQPACNTGFASCDNSFANGCETDIRTLANCGTCGATCAHANATSSCGNGSCGLASCNSGFGNCNNNTADGCEQQLNTQTHCGQCGRACSLGNAASSCSSGSCQVSTCNAGFGNCDANAANGCETNLTNNTSHCNACGAACPANFACQAGRCVCDANSDCASGQNCCGGSCIDIRSDRNNCGACGNVCASGQTCCSGTCRNLTNDFNNCGSCGRSCGSNSNRCTNSACRCTDDSPCGAFFMCCANGCHTPLLCSN